MAENRGGYRDPKPNASPGGPGKASKRNDGGSLKQAPELDRRDIKSGDVGAIEQRMAQRPLQGQNGPNLGQSGPGQGGGALPNVPLGEMQGGGLPPMMFGPSRRPNEPTTAGLAGGAGAGPEALQAPPGQEDFRTWKLRQLATTFGNQDAIEILMEMEESELRRERAVMPGPLEAAPVMDEIEDEDEDVDLEAFEDEEGFEDEAFEESEEMDEFGEPLAEGEEEMLMAEEEAALADADEGDNSENNIPAGVTPAEPASE